MTATVAPLGPSAGGPVRAVRPLVLVTAVGVWAQSVLAGVFLQGGSRGNYPGWILAHGIVADVLLGTSLLAALLSLPGPRRRTVLLAGTFVLLGAEALLGHLINGSIGGSNHDGLVLVHVPLGVALLSLATWNVLRPRSA